MKAPKQLTKNGAEKKTGKRRAEKRLRSDDGPITPRLAFRAFALEDEWHGRRRMRSVGRSLDYAKFAPNACGEIFTVYCDALGKPKAEWFICCDQKGKIVHRQKYVHATQEEAARDLLAIAKNATALLSELIERHPELCRVIAASKSEWPLLADLTEKDWQRHAANVVAKLELGKDIKGYLLAARTADENVIRCWAAAIYETLFQTRFDYKRALEKPSGYMTTNGCPKWVPKTLDLPRFTKADSRKWAKLGEEMLLEQQPNFLESPDLAAKKRSWTHRAQNHSRTGKASLRAIQREAFEDFAKELKNIAPEKYPWRGAW